MNYRMVALDMDGTLLHDDHSLSARNAETIREIAARGVEIVLCTGRSPDSTLPYLEQLGLEGTVITHNGASTVSSVGRELIHRYEMPHASLEPYIAYCREHDVLFDVNTTFVLYVDQLDKLPEDALHMYKEFLITPQQFPGWGGMDDNPVKLTLGGQKEEMDKVEQDLNLWTHELQYVRSGDYFIDIMHPEATKGNALKQLAAQRGIPREQILAIGNYFNDVTMLQFAGMGIAMDNSPLEVKAAAQDVTLSNNDDGVHAALVKYCLS
ncbi:Cof-type HAD-IIB family hydrolase [Paenibacillus sp. 481]|uniref:Cof-type HAD-IIB family hydrolase n=1 Tax=Paenibacillus sp. 481 TaxID=2835869 RepID=UPI001E29F993|nr:Cof-type HAD-IIB family hydrolase [Paenibacillus sp. 481]UHA72648.1 HAD family phosphatase [Paenibacillus sp. 481]